MDQVGLGPSGKDELGENKTFCKIGAMERRKTIGYGSTYEPKTPP